MKNFKEMMEETLSEGMSYYTPGDSIEFNIDAVAKYNSEIEMDGTNYGLILSMSGSNYNVRLDNGNMILVKNEDAVNYWDGVVAPE